MLCERDQGNRRNGGWCGCPVARTGQGDDAHSQHSQHHARVGWAGTGSRRPLPGQSRSPQVSDQHITSVHSSHASWASSSSMILPFTSLVIRTPQSQTSPISTDWARTRETNSGRRRERRVEPRRPSDPAPEGSLLTWKLPSTAAGSGSAAEAGLHGSSGRFTVTPPTTPSVESEVQRGLEAVTRFTEAGAGCRDRRNRPQKPVLCTLPPIRPHPP